MLYDYQCLNTNCNHTFEDLQNHDEPLPVCPKCQSTTEKVLFCHKPTSHSPKYADMHNEYVLMRKRMTGQLPWRKSSDSQTKNG